MTPDRLGRWVVGLLAFAPWVAWGAPVRALEPEPWNRSLTLEYRAPASCPPFEEVLAGLKIAIAGKRLDPPPVRLEIRHLGDRYVGRVLALDAGGRPALAFTTVPESARCDAVVEYGVKTIAMARVPKLIDEIRDRAKHGARVAGAGGPGAGQGDSDEPEPRSGHGWEVEPKPKPDGRDQPPEPSPPPETGEAGLRHFVGAEAHAARGMLPRWGWGAGLAYEIGGPSLAFRVSLAQWLGQSEGIARGDVQTTEVIDIEQQSGDAGLCQRALVARWMPAEVYATGCVEVGLRRIHARVSSSDRSASGLWGAAGLSGGAQVEFASGWRLEARAVAHTAIQPTTVSIPPRRGSYFQPDPQQVGLRLALGYFRF